ncbi:MAG: glycosyltransferase family 4 protein [Deltaproteobacteria bacterium]
MAILAPIHLTQFKSYLSMEGDSVFPSGMGGYAVNSLIEARLRNGLATDVITLDPEIRGEMLKFSGPLLRVWVVKKRASGAIRNGFSRERELMMDALSESQPDLVHAHWTYEYGLAAVTQSRYPYIVTVHDHTFRCAQWLGVRYLPLALISLYVILRAQHVTAVSSSVGAFVEQFRRRKVPVIPNVLPRIPVKGDGGGVSLLPQTPRKRTLVSAVNWSSLKNSKRGLAAFQFARLRLLEHGISLNYTIIGPDMNPNGPAAKWAQGHNLADGVLFLGVVPYEDALKIIASADVLFHPSHEEAMPGPVCEALAMGVPVVACREASGSRWLCGEGRGILCDGYSPEDMAEKIAAACIDTKPAGIDGAKVWMNQYASAERVLGLWSEVYEQAIQVSVL